MCFLLESWVGRECSSLEGRAQHVERREHKSPPRRKCILSQHKHIETVSGGFWITNAPCRGRKRFMLMQVSQPYRFDCILCTCFSTLVCVWVLIISNGDRDDIGLLITRLSVNVHVHTMPTQWPVCGDRFQLYLLRYEIYRNFVRQKVAGRTNKKAQCVTIVMLRRTAQALIPGLDYV